MRKEREIVADFKESVSLVSHRHSDGSQNSEKRMRNKAIKTGLSVIKLRNLWIMDELTSLHK